MRDSCDLQLAIHMHTSICIMYIFTMNNVLSIDPQGSVEGEGRVSFDRVPYLQGHTKDFEKGGAGAKRRKKLLS